MRLPGPRRDGPRITAPGQMLVFVNGYPAIRGLQPLYFADAVFSARAAVPPPEQSDVVLREMTTTTDGALAQVDGLDVEVGS